jgi:hypothetical protein
MPTNYKKFVVKRTWLQDTKKSLAEHKDSLHKVLGFSKNRLMSYLSFTLLLSQYVLDSFSGLPQLLNCFVL